MIENIKTYIKNNWKNPIELSSISLIVTFIISFIVLYYKKPRYITDICQHGNNIGRKQINYYLLTSFSLLFAVLVASIVLVLRTGNDVVEYSKGIQSKPILGYQVVSQNIGAKIYKA